MGINTITNTDIAEIMVIGKVDKVTIVSKPNYLSCLSPLQCYAGLNSEISIPVGTTA